MPAVWGLYALLLGSEVGVEGRGKDCLVFNGLRSTPAYLLLLHPSCDRSCSSCRPEAWASQLARFILYCTWQDEGGAAPA